MTDLDMNWSNANQHLANVLRRGARLHLLRRQRTKRGNVIVEVVYFNGQEPALTAKPVPLGRYIAAIIGRPYLYPRSTHDGGVLLKRGMSADEMVQRVSNNLFGAPDQLASEWL